MSARAVGIPTTRRVRGRGFRRLGPGGRVGVGVVVLVVAVALLGPVWTPHEIDEPIGAPGSPPGDGALLGTDFLGRDVLSRVLAGGLELFTLSVVCTLLTYLVGLSLGMLAGYRGRVLDPLVMRTADLVLSFPPLLLLLVLLGSAGTGPAVLMVGVVLVVSPGIVRVVRTATLVVSRRGYVEAAMIQGESTPAILRREILPAILPVAMADFGIRFGTTVVLIASLSYLGLGVQQPDANWALMVSENRAVMTTNLWALLVPGLLLGALTIAVNLVADDYVAALEASGRTP